MLPAPRVRQQESGPAPPMGGKALVLSHQRKSHAHVARDHQETLASASLQLRSTTPMAEVPTQRGPHRAWHGKAFCHLPPAFSPAAVLRASLPARGKDLAQALTISPQPQGLRCAQLA